MKNKKNLHLTGYLYNRENPISTESVHVCPVCRGTGKEYEPIDYCTKPIPCHGCAPWGSLGWVKT